MGTEIIVSDDKTYGTLLGASPGASVSPEVMLRLLEQLMPTMLEDTEVKTKLAEIFPTSCLTELEKDADLYRQIRDDVNKTLGIV
jgi:malate dehydrogenase (quinone)